MSSSVNLLLPCPVQIGSIRYDSDEKELHEYVKHGKYMKVKKILKKGVPVDSVNSLGQTPLFVAAILGVEKVVHLLLKFNSDPNHRCFDGSTPVHAAAFSCNPWILSKIIDAGGDLRLHDQEGRTPYSWAVMAGKDQNAEMLEFIDRCASHIQTLAQCFPSEPFTKMETSHDLIRCPSLFNVISQGPLPKFLKDESLPKNIANFGYGKLCIVGKRQLACMAYIPFIQDKHIVQEDEILTFSFPVGPYMIMTNLLWDFTKVTVKELSKIHTECSKSRFSDLLIAEQENMSRLHHPSLLQLIGVCVSPDLGRTRIIFERITFGTLYSILHERRSEFPILHMETILHFLLQVIDGLMYLHQHGFIHRSLSSYAVVIVAAGLAKICNFEYMIERSGENRGCDSSYFPVPAQLYPWSAPEVILGRNATLKSDVYSFCAVIQEILTDNLPWNGLDGMTIKEAVASHHYLVADLSLPKPYDDIVRAGIQAKSKDRIMNLQNIRCLLKNDFKDIVESKNCATVSINPPYQGMYPDPNICLQSSRMMTKSLHGHQTKQSYIHEEHQIMEEEDKVHHIQESTKLDCSKIKERPVGERSTEESQRVIVTSVCNAPDYDRIKMSSFPECQTEASEELTDQHDAMEFKRNSIKKSDTENQTLNLETLHFDNLSLSETSTSEADTPSDTVDDDIQMLEDKLCSIQKHISSSIDHLTVLSQQFKTCDNADKQRYVNSHNDAQKKTLEDPSSQSFPCKSTDEVDNAHLIVRSKLSAAWRAVGPPVVYVPQQHGLQPRSHHLLTRTDMTKVCKENFSRTQQTEMRNRKCWSACDAKQSTDFGKPQKTMIPKNPTKSNDNLNDETHDNNPNTYDRSTAKNVSGHQKLEHACHRAEMSPVWSSDVKRMAHGAASGNLHFFRHVLQNQDSSDSCSDQLDEPFQYIQGKEKEKLQTGYTQENTSPEETDDESEKDDSSEEELEKIFHSFARRKCWFPGRNDSAKITDNYEHPIDTNGKTTGDHGEEELQDHSATTFYTAELDISFSSDTEGTGQEHINVTQEMFASKLVPLGTKESSGAGTERLSYWATEKTFEKDLTKVGSLGFLDNASNEKLQQAGNVEHNDESHETHCKESSVIDIQELSSILCDNKSASKHCSTPGSKSVSFAISTPVSSVKLRAPVGSRINSAEHTFFSIDTSRRSGQETSSEMSSTMASGPVSSTSTNEGVLGCSILRSPKNKTYIKYTSTAAITLSRSHEQDYQNKSMSFVSQLEQTGQSANNSSQLGMTENGRVVGKENTICDTYEETDRCYTPPPQQFEPF
uniref:Inactive serine/threonine-protein kinase TEX14 n=1 Tax=Leptobrachium leishanense TaxID=445787 RepID=A0A8C5LWD9_9ANUR